MDNYLVYECNNSWGYASWPTPQTIPAGIVDESEQNLTPKNHNDLSILPFLFIDDGYDPTSRVRKGKIYEREESQPKQCFVQPHPAIPSERAKINADGFIEKYLATFRKFDYRTKVKQLDINDPIIVLSSNTQFTIWSVIDVETSIAGETILYLKSRKTIGLLPKVDFSKFDEDQRDQVKEKLGLLSDDVYKAGADSIVDRAREAASALINAYLINKRHINKHKDLGQLVIPLREIAQKTIAANCAETLAKLHSRTKHVEQINRGLRAINELDAELAVNSIGMILTELGYVRL